uniref:Putative secreted protein n=1 Tax=Anopheles marajoara TaxID=58244 RepID=A0A2M4C7K1_9DIPT
MLLLLLLLLLLLGCWRWTNELGWLHMSSVDQSASTDEPARLGGRSLVLACRGRRRHLVRHKPWTIGSRGGRVGGRNDRRREAPMVPHDRCLSGRMLQVDGRRVTVHAAVQRHAASG